ncbi:MAG: hypothetical protein GY750_16995, partial [Lentisphaerae bacterium]|nr:hypothetical protein [Delftia sp.]MCP4103094.1 hypothetical protein [Lentisphaerota bacterium]
MSEDRINYCNEVDCQGWPGCACRTPQFWQEYERQALREQQARDVMPQIGPLLDAWEGLPNDTRHDLCEESPALANAVRLIEEAM